MKGSLGNIIHYAIRVEFQVRGSPHFHCFLWVGNAPKLSSENVDEFTDFVDKSVKCELPKRQNINVLHKLVRTYQTHHHSKSLVENTKISSVAILLESFF